MMDFAPATPPRRQGEPIVPMINIVFLLLIFFMMSASIAAPDPFEVIPPNAAIEAETLPPGVLFVASDGTLAFVDARGEAVFAALQAEALEELAIRADARLPAAELAQLLPRLAEVGVTQYELISVLP